MKIDLEPSRSGLQRSKNIKKYTKNTEKNLYPKDINSRHILWHKLLK